MTPNRSVVRIFLTGISGAGKSSVAHALANRLGWRVRDTDALIVDQTGHSTAHLFRTRGEPAFRELERTVVRATATEEHVVVALGGGAFLDPDTRLHLLTQGLVIWLQVDPREAARRLTPALPGEPRPLLGKGDVAVRLDELLKARSDAYSQAHLHIATDGHSPAEIADDVLAHLPAPVEDRPA